MPRQDEITAAITDAKGVIDDLIPAAIQPYLHEDVVEAIVTATLAASEKVRFAELQANMGELVQGEALPVQRREDIGPPAGRRRRD